MRFLSALILKMRNFGPELEKCDIFVQCGLGIRGTTGEQILNTITKSTQIHRDKPIFLQTQGNRYTLTTY